MEKRFNGLGEHKLVEIYKKCIVQFFIKGQTCTRVRVFKKVIYLKRFNTNEL